MIKLLRILSLSTAIALVGVYATTHLGIDVAKAADGDGPADGGGDGGKAKGNNGFGNGGSDGVSGKSGKTDTNR